MRHPAIHIAPPRGRLGVMLVGLGAVVAGIALANGAGRRQDVVVSGPFKL